MESQHNILKLDGLRQLRPPVFNLRTPLSCQPSEVRVVDVQLAPSPRPLQIKVLHRLWKLHFTMMPESARESHIEPWINRVISGWHTPSTRDTCVMVGSRYKDHSY